MGFIIQLRKGFIGCGMFFMFAASAHAMTVSGVITANNVVASGNVTASSITVSTLTISNLLDVNTVSGIKGLTVKTVSVSTDNVYSMSMSTPTAVPGMTASITLSNARDYVRISLSGSLIGISTDTTHLINPQVNLTIQRDGTNLASRPFITSDSLDVLSVGLTIIDFPGGTSSHDYTVMVDNGGAPGQVVQFTPKPVSYLLLEEIAQ